MDKYLGRKVNTFRCQIDPMVGPKPRNAFVPSTMGMEAEITTHGIFVRVCPYGSFNGSEHIIPFANIQSIRLEPQADIQDEAIELKRKPGRPLGS